MKEGQIRCVIPTRGRWTTIAKHTLRFFPQATLFVHAEEEPEYRRIAPGNEIVPHGPCRTLGHLRNMLLDTFDEEVIVSIDDDLKSVTSYVGMSVRRLTDPTVIEALVYNAAEIAYGSGSWLFGFGLNPSPKHFNPLNPMTVHKPRAYCLIGIVGRRVRFDENLSMFDDHDLNLQALKAGGNIFGDMRLFFQFDSTGGVGGNFVQFRNAEKEAREQAYLQKKWGMFFKRKSLEV
jgi:hypothetical protein